MILYLVVSFEGCHASMRQTTLIQSGLYLAMLLAVSG